MLTYIELDGTRIEFINGKPQCQREDQRQKSRHLREGIYVEEQNLLQEMTRRNFLYRISPIYALIKRNIPNKKLSYKLFRGLGWFFSIQLNIPFPREYYRRKGSCIFWLQLDYQEIKEFMRQHILSINYDHFDFLIQL